MLALLTSNVIYSWNWVSPYAYYRCRGLRAAVNQARKQLEAQRVTDANIYNHRGTFDYGTCWRPNPPLYSPFYEDSLMTPKRNSYCKPLFKEYEEAEFKYNNCLKPLPRLPINFIDKTY